MALTRDNILDELVSKYKLQRREAKDVLDTMIDDMKKVIEEGGRAKLAGFGSLVLNYQYYARKRRNIQEEHRWRTVTFIPSIKLKARIQRADIEISRDVD